MLHKGGVSIKDLLFILILLFGVSACGRYQNSNSTPNSYDNSVSSEGDLEAGLASQSTDPSHVSNDNEKGAFFVEKVKEAEHLDFLFYLQTKESLCLYKFNTLVKKYGFLKYFHHLKWQAGFAFYSDDADLLPLASNNAVPASELNIDPSPARIEFERDLFINKRFASKHGHVLSYDQRTERFRKRALRMTLAAVYLMGGGGGRGDLKATRPSVSHLNTKPGVKDPLSGLKDILTKSPHGVIRDDSHVVVLLFSWFPFYSNEDWEEFFDTHNHVSLVVLNPLVFREKEQKERLSLTGAVDFVNLCQAGEAASEESLKELVKVIQGKFE